ncbi:hypothetical protein J3F84DRAFT_381584 [Trichoderma pleuroticola]
MSTSFLFLSEALLLDLAQADSGAKDSFVCLLPWRKTRRPIFAQVAFGSTHSVPVGDDDGILAHSQHTSTGWTPLMEWLDSAVCKEAACCGESCDGRREPWPMYSSSSGGRGG